MKAANIVPLMLLLASCGGGAASAPPPEAPPAGSSAPVNMAAAEPSPTPASTAAEPAAPAPSAPASPAPSAAPAKIEFPPHASVEAATKAVPQGAARMNMNADTLQAPLMDMKRYEKCKVPRSTKVFLNVAVYDGAAVGVDVTTKPKNAKLEECLDGVVRSMSWDKVPSLNQVNANF
jgi:hypothetical protein